MIELEKKNHFNKKIIVILSISLFLNSNNMSTNGLEMINS